MKLSWKIWKKRKQILEGFLNKIFPKPKVEEIAEYRLDICRSNYCKYYDKNGTSEKAVLKGEESCGVCGCNLGFLTRAMGESCSLKEIGEQPLWTEEKRYMDESQNTF